LRTEDQNYNSSDASNAKISSDSGEVALRDDRAAGEKIFDASESSLNERSS